MTALRGEIEGAVARFSALPGGFNTGGIYHASQTTRGRQYSGETAWGGARLQTEEQLLKPYDRGTIISRGRIMIRNNPWVTAIFLSYVQEIGAPTYKSTADLGDEKKSAAYNDLREHRFGAWAQDCESGTDLSLDEVVEIWGYERIIGGELFVVKLYTGELQLIPSELCGSPLTGYVTAEAGAASLAGATFTDGTPVPVGTEEKDGILRLNRRIIGYRFAQRDPITGYIDFTATGKTTLVAAGYVVHLYDRDRVEQGRGVPMTAPILAKLQDLFETGDARSQQVKNAACLSMWITKNMDPYGFAEAMKGAMRTSQVQDAVALKTIAEQRSNYTELRAGAVYVGAVNEDVKLIEPKLGSGDWHDHYVDLVQICCAVLDGMPVEVGLEGFRASSYSSSRATMNKWKRNVKRRRRRTEQKLLDPLQLWQTRRFELFGVLDSIDARQRAECHWGWPAIPDIDGLKTSAQNAADLAMGSITLREIYSENGRHYEQGIKQWASEKATFLKELIAAGLSAGLTPDEARSWALTQIPTGDGRALAALITATGALGAEATPGAPAE